MSEAEKNEIWRLVGQGWSLAVVGRRLGRGKASVVDFVAASGGVRPPVRCRRPVQLSLWEREEISRGLAAGLALRAIARQLGRAPSTVSREVRRNGGPKPRRASGAGLAAWERACRPKASKLVTNRRLREVVEIKLALDWSPEQISGWLVEAFPDEPEMRVSHETIYLSLFVQARGALRKELAHHLRTRRSSRRPRGYSPINGQGQLRDTVHISERPAEANDRAVPGHWEGDLIFGKGMTAVATLVERKTRFAMLIGLPNGHTADVVADALAAKIVELPEQLRRSLTWDHGKEMAQHARFSVATGVPVFFCDPRSPWQRGWKENTNAPLRPYLAQRVNLRDPSRAELDATAERHNR